MMKNVPFARKKRQLAYAMKQFKRLPNHQKTAGTGPFQALLRKINRLVEELRRVIPSTQLNKMLKPLALAAGLYALPATAIGQTFVGPTPNPFGLTNDHPYTFPTFVDIDNDGDYDIMEGRLGGISFWENTGTPTEPQFVPPVTNPFNLNSTNANLPTFADLDGDGDKDMFSIEGSYSGVTLLYLENAGTGSTPSFATPVGTPFGMETPDFSDLGCDYSVSPSFVDIDNDGDYDLVIMQGIACPTLELSSSRLFYFENTGTPTTPQFGTYQVNPFGITDIDNIVFFSTEFSDLDMDGDFDMIVGEYYGNTYYYENTGTAASPQFPAHLVNPFGLEPVYYFSYPTTSDLDNDGDVDLLLGSYNEGFLYYENTDLTNTEDPLLGDALSLSPNPVGDALRIEYGGGEMESVSVFDAVGRQVDFHQGTRTTIPTGHWIPGLYWLKITDKEGRITTAKVRKE